MKIQISIDDELLKRGDRYADENYMSRSGLISLALNEYLSAKEFMLMVKDISLAMRKIADTGNIDDETLEQLADYERVVKMLSGTK